LKVERREQIERASNLLVFLIIKFLILSVSLEVIVSLFAKCDEQHKHKRSYIREHEADFQGRDELGERDEKEEQVVEELELVEKDNRKECDDVVLLVPNPI